MAVRHTYEGECGLRFEQTYESVNSDIPVRMACTCSSLDCYADILWELPRKRHAYVAGIVFYENAKGEIRVPTDPNDPAPGAGYQRKEVQLYEDIQKLEKRLTDQERSKASRFREVSHIDALRKQKENRDYLMQGEMVPEVIMNKDGEWVETGRMKRLPGFYEMSEHGKDLARAAMERGNEMLARRELRQVDPEVFFRHMHYDSRRR